jgi:hypothetical protein
MGVDYNPTCLASICLASISSAMLAEKIVFATDQHGLTRINTDFSWVTLWILLGLGDGARYETDWTLLDGASWHRYSIRVQSVLIRG